MIRLLTVVALATALAAPAFAQPKPRLMFIHDLKDTTAHLQVGGFIDAWTLDDNIAVGDLDAGSHVVHVTLPDGRKLSRGFLFWATKLVDRGGRRYWCVVLDAPAASDDALVLLEPEDCRNQLKALDGR